jgi:CheY-like chemotaxis protein
MPWRTDSRPPVLVADDDPGIRKLLGQALDHGGYLALPARDVREAIDFLRVPGCVAAIIDMLFVNSGGMSGLDILRFIRSDAHHKDLPVMMVTGFSLNRNVLAEIEKQHAQLWNKPFDPDYLVTALRQRVDGRISVAGR